MVSAAVATRNHINNLMRATIKSCLIAATNFSKIIAELEATQTNLLTGLAGNKELLDNVQEAFAVNLENVNKEVSKLEGRLNAIEPKEKK